MSSSAGPRSGAGGGRRHAAGAFDIRTIIAALVGFYGIVLIVMGLAHNGPVEQSRTGGINFNLWSGVVMVVFGLIFLAWTLLRPIVVDPHEVERAGDDVTGEPHP